MKASEAIEMLKQLSPNHEVTLIFGDAALKNRDFNPTPYQPQFVPSYVRNPEDIWCKTNNIKFH